MGIHAAAAEYQLSAALLLEMLGLPVDGGALYRIWHAEARQKRGPLGVRDGGPGRETG